MLDTQYIVCSVQSIKGGLRDWKLWGCVHSKVDLTICLQTSSYNIPAQSLAKRSVVQGSDYHKIWSVIEWHLQKTYESALLVEVCVALGGIIYICSDKDVFLWRNDYGKDDECKVFCRRKLINGKLTWDLGQDDLI